MEGVTIERPLPGVIHCEFPNAYLAASTFLRFQEHYESPRFAGMVFSLEEYMDWYASEHEGKFTYYEDWNGFNVPSRVFAPFREGKFDPLSQKETWLLEQVRDEPEPFYAIGTIRGTSPLYRRHELAHARFALDADYRRAVCGVLARLPKQTRACCERAMRAKGYGSNVIEDEIHAHLLTWPQRLKSTAKCLPTFSQHLKQLLRS